MSHFTTGLVQVFGKGKFEATFQEETKIYGLKISTFGFYFTMLRSLFQQQMCWGQYLCGRVWVLHMCVWPRLQGPTVWCRVTVPGWILCQQWNMFGGASRLSLQLCWRFQWHPMWEQHWWLPHPGSLPQWRNMSGWCQHLQLCLPLHLHWIQLWITWYLLSNCSQHQYFTAISFAQKITNHLVVFAGSEFHFSFESEMGITLVNGSQLTTNGKVCHKKNHIYICNTQNASLLHCIDFQLVLFAKHQYAFNKLCLFRPTKALRQVPFCSNILTWETWALPASPSLTPASLWAMVEAPLPSGSIWWTVVEVAKDQSLALRSLIPLDLSPDVGLERYGEYLSFGRAVKIIWGIALVLCKWEKVQLIHNTHLLVYCFSTYLYLQPQSFETTHGLTTLNQWIHVAAVFNGSGLIGYRDGTDVALTISGEASPEPGNGVVHIGQHYTGLYAPSDSSFSEQESVYVFIVTPTVSVVPKQIV